MFVGVDGDMEMEYGYRLLEVYLSPVIDSEDSLPT